jgi:hypothetical protein
MISITTIESKTVDSVFFDELPTSIFRDTPPRFRRTATLDGGAVLDHRGFADGDRKFTIAANVSEAIANDLWTIHKAETLVNISCPEGFFVGSIGEMKVDGGRLQMVFYVKE